ncbi:hypothetical protein FKM82_016370 [Ascaphus truei]
MPCRGKKVIIRNIELLVPQSLQSKPNPPSTNSNGYFISNHELRDVTLSPRFESTAANRRCWSLSAAL